MVCPNKNSLEWKKLVSEVGETFAAKVFIASGNMLPEMSIINKYIDEIKSSAKFFIVDKGMPFSGDLINKVKLNQQKFTIRQNFHNQGVYKIDINESLEVIPLSKEPITFNDALNILNISKNNFIEQFKGKSNIKIPQINDFLNNQNKLYVYKLNYLSTQPLQQSSVRPSTGLTDAQILNSPNFAAFYLKELESNPDLSTEDALEYYKKCKQ